MRVQNYSATISERCDDGTLPRQAAAASSGTRRVHRLPERQAAQELSRGRVEIRWLPVGGRPAGSVAEVNDRLGGFAEQPLGRPKSASSLQDCIAHLRRQLHDAYLFVGDSTDLAIVEKVKELSPFDAIFIDANHTEPYVRADFKHYGRLSRIVCFHDIGWNNPTAPGKLPIEVPKVWNQLKQTYKDHATFSEIKRDNGHNGIGIIQWN